MLTRLRNKFSKTKPAVGTVKAAPARQYRYNVLVPGQIPVVLRAANLVEVKATVREAHGFTRLPAGTKIERLP